MNHYPASWGGNLRQHKREETFQDPNNSNVRHTTTSTIQSGGGYYDDSCFLWAMIGFFVVLGFIALYLVVAFSPGGHLHCATTGCNSLCDAVEECSVIEDILDRLALLEAAP